MISIEEIKEKQEELNKMIEEYESQKEVVKNDLISTMKYTIDYGYGTAILYTPSKNWEERFYDLAGQCFGIRKSIMYAVLISKEEKEYPNKLDNEYERLEHNGDIIVWDKNETKIKSEFDD